MKRPVGVTAVAVLTMLVVAALAYLFLIFAAFSMIFGMTESGRVRAHATLFVMFFGFLLSYSILKRVDSKYVWYGSFVYWIALSIFFIYVYHTMGVWRYMWYMEGPLSTWYGVLSLARILVLPSPFIYAVGCSAYFLTKNPRAYFNV